MKIALITGASQGIGASIAKVLNKVKIKVILVARSRKNLKQIQKNLTYPKYSKIISKDLRSWKSTWKQAGTNIGAEIDVNFERRFFEKSLFFHMRNMVFSDPAGRS